MGDSVVARPQYNKPTTHDPSDFLKAGLSESSATSSAYRGGTPKLENDDALQMAYSALLKLLEDENPDVRLKAVDLAFKHIRRTGKPEEFVHEELEL